MSLSGTIPLWEYNFIGNVATDGAALSTSTYRSAYFTHCNFIANRADRGAVIYKGTTSATYFNRCKFEYNSANVGTVFYQDAYEGSDHLPEGYVSVNSSYLNSNVASDLASIFYSKSGNLCINGSVIDNNRNNPIYNGKGYLIVTNSYISNY